MIRAGRATARSVTGPIIVGAVLVLALVACSAEVKPSAKSSPGATSASTSAAASGALKDESAAVLAWTPPAPVGTTQGMLTSRFVPGPATIPSTADIISVQAGSDSTILTWQLSSATDNSMAGFTLGFANRAKFMPDAVRLVDPVAQKSYAVNTMTLHGPAYDTYYCVCSRFPTHVGPDPVRMTSAYPALPAGATSVSVRIPNFAPVTVPVTR